MNVFYKKIKGFLKIFQKYSKNISQKKSQKQLKKQACVVRVIPFAPIYNF
jgi:hypothetical protein